MMTSISLSERNVFARIGLRRLRRRCQRDGHPEHCEAIDSVLDDQEALSVLSGEVAIRMDARPDDLMLSADDEGPLMRFLRFFIENGDTILKLIEKILVLFAI